VDADRWKQVEDCYHFAQERPPDERARFLAQACAHDPELRREVESLLGHEGQADGLLESPAWDQVTPPDETNTFAPGEAEASFRALKSELSIRPQFHQKESRVKAHVMVAFRGYAMWVPPEALLQRRAPIHPKPSASGVDNAQPFFSDEGPLLALHPTKC